MRIKFRLLIHNFYMYFKISLKKLKFLMFQYLPYSQLHLNDTKYVINHVRIILQFYYLFLKISQSHISKFCVIIHETYKRG